MKLMTVVVRKGYQLMDSIKPPLEWLMAPDHERAVIGNYKELEKYKIMSPSRKRVYSMMLKRLNAEFPEEMTERKRKR